MKAKVDLDDDQPRKAVLKGIVVDAGGQKRTADQNFYVDIPPAAKTVHLSFTRDDQQVAAVDVPIEASTSAPLLCASGDWMNGTEADGTQSKFRTPSTYCYAGMALIAGDFNGDAEQTKVEVGGLQARIVAESVRYCYWMLPRTTGPGINEVTLHEDTHVVKFKVRIPRLDFRCSRSKDRRSPRIRPLPMRRRRTILRLQFRLESASAADLASAVVTTKKSAAAGDEGTIEAGASSRGLKLKKINSSSKAFSSAARTSLVVALRWLRFSSRSRSASHLMRPRGGAAQSISSWSDFATPCESGCDRQEAKVIDGERIGA